MTDKARVLKAIYQAIDAVNETLPEDQQVAKTADVVLFGQGGCLDSLGLINFMSELEELIEDKFDAVITLADENAVSEENNPFQSYDKLADYVVMLIEEESDG